MMNNGGTAEKINSQNSLAQFECPNCAEQGKVWGFALGAPVIRCSHCDLHFLEKDTRPATVVDNDWCRELVEGPAHWSDAFLKTMGEPYRKQVRNLGKVTADRSILDFGAGPGVFLSIAKSEGWKALGVEASPFARQYGTERYNLDYVKELSEVSAKSFGAVRMSHVLEHIPEPQPLLKDIKRVLKPDGALSVIVPNREPLLFNAVNRARRLFSETPRLSGAIYPDMHVLGFTRTSLRRMLERAGFEVLSVSTVSMGNSTYYPWLYDGFLNKRPLKDVLTIPRLLAGNLVAAADNLGNPFGLGTWVVATCKNR